MSSMFTLGPWEAGTVLGTVVTVVSGKDLLCSSY